jgi:hypothetical protein
MNCLIASLCLPLLLTFATPCPAGQPSPHRDDAAIEKVVAAATAAGRKMDWNAYAELLHPESLEDYKNIWLPVLRGAAKEGRDKQTEQLRVFANASDLKSVMALKPKEFFVSSMKGMASQFSGTALNPLIAEEKIIGTVHEGDDQAYVVIRTRRKFDGAVMSQVGVVALKRSGTEWKMMLPDSVRILAETYRRIGWETQKSGPVRDRADPDKGK